jgi:hypothetical protein
MAVTLGNVQNMVWMIANGAPWNYSTLRPAAYECGKNFKHLHLKENWRGGGILFYFLFLFYFLNGVVMNE